VKFGEKFFSGGNYFFCPSKVHKKLGGAGVLRQEIIKTYGRGFDMKKVLLVAALLTAGIATQALAGGGASGMAWDDGVYSGEQLKNGKGANSGGSGSSGGGYGSSGYGGSDRGSSSSGPVYMRTKCVSGYKDWAAMCCMTFKDRYECEKNGKTCSTYDMADLNRRTEAVSKRASAAPACMGSD
jgi:hypothetical protein